ncbi:MAG: sensor histidine kinase [Bacteroidota bacterium]
MARRIPIEPGLQAKMIFSVVLLLSLLTMVTTYTSIKRDSQGIFDQMRKDGEALALSYALSAENAILVHAGLSRLTGVASRTKGIEYLKIVNKDLRIIGHTDIRLVGTTDRDELCRQALMTPVTAVEKGRRPRTKVEEHEGGRKTCRVVVPLVILDSVIGVLEIGLEMTSIAQAVRRTNNQSLVIALFALAFGVAYVWLFARTMTHPIKELVRAAERIATGDLETEIVVATKDEIGQLAASFNYMTERLRDYTGNLVKANAQLETHAATIEKLQRYTENILASITTGVITLDLAGDITTLNEAGARILQLRREEAVGKRIGAVFDEGHGLRTLLEEALTLEREYQGRELTIAGEDRGELLLNVNTAWLRQRGTVPVGLAATFEDVTEVRQLQKRINESEKLAAMGELVVGIAHEVRNPLGALKTCAQFLVDKLTPDDARYKFVQLILRETERLNHLVERLLNFARPGEKDFQYEDLGDILEKVTSLAELKAREQKVSLVTECGADLPRVFADAKRLQQAFLNIILNALDAMPDGGRCGIKASFAAADGQVLVELSDTGEGIPAPQLEKIFAPFFSTRRTGTGLGLAIVRQIVAEHNGSIEVRSTVGEGTVFAVRLPACAEPGFGGHAPVPENPPPVPPS